MEKTIIERMCDIRDKMRPNKSTRQRGLTDQSVDIAKITSAAEDIRALCEILNLNDIQVVLLIAIVQKSCGRLNIDDLSQYLGLDYLEFLKYDIQLESLRKKGFIRRNTAGCITIPQNVLASLKENRPVEPEKTTDLSTGQILVRIKRQLTMIEHCEQSIIEAHIQIMDILSDNPDTSISRAFSQHSRIYRLTSDEFITFCVLIYRYWFQDDDMVGMHDLDDYLDDDKMEDIKVRYYSERLQLQRYSIIEYTSDGEMLTKDYFHIKDDIKAEIFADVGGLRKKHQLISASSKLEAGQISRKELFYNDAEGRQVEQLRQLLSEARFKEIRSKLKEKGLRTGFTCLLYGGPGTGKTETVYQLARESGRDLFIVDVSQIKSCWVGETEKNIKDVFDKYRASVAGGGTIPILLFNEADAIFGIRQEGATRAVEKMENSIQNIILQEMEDLDGILIATTNLTQNLDKAFERRFLYKIRFDKPSVDAKTHIWQTMIPSLSAGEAEQLAREFDLSGGQIENVARKKAINDIIGLSDTDFDSLRKYCAEETISHSAPVRRIGF